MRRAMFGTGAFLAAMSATFVGQLVWVVRRDLPTQREPNSTPPIDSLSPDPEALRIVALGDSSLTGPGLEHDGLVWLRQAVDRLGDNRPISVASLAVGGSRVADVLGRVPEALQLRPDLVVIAVGANDALHGTWIPSFRRMFERLIAQLLDDVPVVAVASVGDLGNIARVPAPLKSVLRLRAARVCRVIERSVARHGRAVLLDVRSADHIFRDRTVFTPDLFHPGASGHSAWAGAAVPGLRDALDLLVAAPTGRRVESTGVVRPGRRTVVGRPSRLRQRFA